jgi:RNA polymerase sigma factor (sigma-70 family)
MTSDLELPGRFAREKSQDACTALVQRHLNLVYSAALRQVRSPQLAGEVTQSVFTDLVRMAATPAPPTVLTPWLYAVTRRTAIDVIRKESRRQLREQIAVETTNMNATANDWNQIEPLLDDAMAALDETDRAVVLLRYAYLEDYSSADYLTRYLQECLSLILRLHDSQVKFSRPLNHFSV